ncbi:hypothetical protein [Fundicoccus culcitae]|uniref:DUF340 domain-containing protein n=1 Tax=Fundicoccus culcitae TaxID=2969821 RepID=A0ABY5P2W2_9LACT|nr:hypothetical protein [Fundicoccus culcitae]UUX32825.1 hypothetical protein NRE15_07805 [Fundicoccus culcitae]
MKSIDLNLILDWIIVLIISGGIALIGNMIGYGASFNESLIGMAWLVLFTLLGFFMKQIIPVDIPSVAYISAIAIIACLPFSPIAETVIASVEKISLLALCTPILAYAGVTIGKDWPAFKKIGYKGVLVSLVVIIGTVLACVVLAEILLRIF